MTAVTLGKGGASPHAGALIAVGHGLVEFPLMVLLFFGLGPVITIVPVRTAITLGGGLFLLLMAAGMFRSMRARETVSPSGARSPLLAGVLLSIGNPYFMVWWATVGAALIIASASYGAAGFLLFAVLHWLCDFFWLYLLSALAYKGGAIMGDKFRRVVSLVSGFLLLFFGGRLIVDGIGMIV
jgi:threonine/homoserine/homoserine lactone efflux protein